MAMQIITGEQIDSFKIFLENEERAQTTIEKYIRDIRDFAHWTGGAQVTKDVAVGWKEQLLSKGLAPATINAKLSAVNSFFRFLGWEGCHMKFLRVQRQIFRERSRELTRDDYCRLLKTAQDKDKKRLALLMETICSTGIRVSELVYITVEAVQSGQATIRLKGKVRTILLSKKLCIKLLKYARKQKLTSGEIFLTGGGKSLSRKQIWREMKALCKEAGVEPSKVFPHNLRHLFATAFYRSCRDIVKLADVLGHSSIETTRIYLISSGVEHAKHIERLGLVS